ncbi:uncharacterized protein NPIL_185231 [Nephila pilipes]|uniref:Uncharacterized protein n=1 Tax=Nephila pilipes TaxID=299642 RepID=A0A8X6QCZ4_NEPPI|nr:uncharacterized protein NPIL_185231 [Nephila pilipes]
MTEEEKAALVQLGRRHTMAESRRASDAEESRRKTSRAKSLDVFEDNIETDVGGKPLGKQSHFSGVPTVIITESELASSQLYKDRKAKINSDDECVDEPKSNPPSDDPESSEPRYAHDPNIRPVPVSMKPRPEKFSSCCCYFLAILIISLASLGVMAAIGGVIYMELFAVYKDSLDIPTTAAPINSEMKPLNSKGRNSRTADEENVNLSENEFHSQEKFSMNGIQKSKNPETDSGLPLRENKILREIPTVTDKSLENNGSKTYNIEISRENSNFDPQSKGMDKSSQINSFNKFSRNIPKLDDKEDKNVSDKLRKLDTISQISQKLRNLRNLNQGTKVFAAEKIAMNDKDNKEVYNDNRSITDKSHEINLSYPNTDKQSKIFRNLGDSVNETRIEDFKLKLNPLNISKTFFEQNSSGISFSNEHVPDNSSIDINKINTTKQDARESFEHQHSSEGSMTNNHSRNHSFDISHPEILTNKTIHLDEQNQNKVFPQNFSELDIQNDRSADQNFTENYQDTQAKNTSQFDEEDQNNSDSSESTQLMLMHPVVESKAVPVPVEFLRRLGFDIKDTKNHQPLTAKDMEIKFSIAEALKYLRSLDTENKLPTSRQKILDQNVIKQNTSKNSEPIKQESKEYLKNLRIKIYEG